MQTRGTSRRDRHPPPRAPRRASHRLAFIGTGYVGLVSGTCLAEIGHRVICVDRNPDKIARLKKGESPIYEPGLEPLIRKNLTAGRLAFSGNVPAAVAHADVIFIAVNTPPRPDGKADLSHVANAVRQVAEAANGYKVIVDKSTVPVKTGEKVRDTLAVIKRNGEDLDVVSNPEFLREGSAVEDFLAPDRIVIGVETERAERIMREIYRPIRAPLIVTDINSAELIKHASNAFLATKISFANALAAICELSGADVENVVRGMGLDARIGPAFLRAGIGWGGSCFPKDVSAFVKIAEELGYDFQLLHDVQRINEEARARFLRKIEDALWVVKGKTIAVWGLAFKPNTDDMRNAPSVAIIERLRSDGAFIHAYDPQATENARRLLGTEGIRYARSPYDALEGADALVIVTDWDAFKTASLTRVKALLRQPLILDGRNVFDPDDMRKRGFVYVSVGRPRTRPAAPEPAVAATARSASRAAPGAATA